MPSNPDLIRRLLDGTASTEERAQLLLDLGELCRQQGLPARPLLEAAATVLPMAASAPLGMLSLVEGAPADAARWFAVAQDVDDPADQAQAIANGATAAFAQGDVAGAEAGFRRAMAVRVGAGLTQDPLLHINLGRCLADLGELDAGLRHLDAATSLAGSLTRPAALADMLAGELAWQHHRTEAASLLRRALSGPLTPIEQARCQVPLADLLQRQGDIDGAIALLQVASAALPPGRDRASALTTLGGCLYLRRALAPAAAALDAAHNELPADSHGTPLHTRLRINRALSLIAQDSLEQALPELTAACEDLRQRDQPEALARQLRSLSDLHRYMGDLDAAIAVQGELVTLEATLDGPLPEGGMLYTPVEDRGLNLSLAQISRAGPQVGTGPVLFLVPPAWGARGPLFPRGAASVASFLVAEGIPAEVLPLADHVLPSDDASTVAQKTQNAVQHAIDALRPRAVGISVTFSYLYPQGLDLAAIARQAAPEGTPILIGGPHVTYQDRECLEESADIDVVVRGEGEWTAVDLLRALETGADLSTVDGITWRAPDGSIHRNKMRKLGDVGALPPVDFSLLPSTFCHRMDVSVLTSRGCSFRCRFCHEFRYWGGKVREFPVSRIIGEMDRLGRYGNHLQGIDDSMLDMSTPFFMELVQTLGKSDRLLPDFGLLTRLDTVTVEGARAMKANGLRWVSMGAESGSQVVLDAMNKGLAVNRIAQSLRIVREAGLESATFFIVGHPGDTPQESAVTLSFLESLWAQDLVSWVDISTFTPYPGTPFFTSPSRHGVRVLTSDWSRWRRTNRPVAELVDYPAPLIYQNFLRMLAVQHRYRGAQPNTAGPELAMS